MYGLFIFRTFHLLSIHSGANLLIIANNEDEPLQRIGAAKEAQGDIYRRNLVTRFISLS